MAELHNAPAFFAAIRRVTGPLTETQAAIANGLLTAAAAWPIGWLAYGFATAWHEARLTPQDEIGRGHGRPYGMPGKHGGQIPFGRGLVQTTWDPNYEWADRICAAAGLIEPGELLANFELANRPDIATRILITGMETGHFTGKRLADFITVRGTHADFVAARRIINGQDCAEKIAIYADQFQDAADLGGWK